MILGSTQPLTEMSTGCISWGKGGRCVRLTTLPPSCAVVMKSGSLKFLEPSEPLQACNGTALPLPLPIYLTVVICKFKVASLTQTLSLRLILHYAMKKCWEVGSISPRTLNWELGRGKTYTFKRRFLNHRR